MLRSRRKAGPSAVRISELFRGADIRDQHVRRPRIGDLRGAGEHVPQRDGLVEEVDRLAGPQEDLRAHLKDANAALVLLALGARWRLTSLPAILIVSTLLGEGLRAVRLRETYLAGLAALAATLGVDAAALIRGLGAVRQVERATRGVLDASHPDVRRASQYTGAPEEEVASR